MNLDSPPNLERGGKTQAETTPEIMKTEEARQRLEQLSAADLRLVAAQLYKMLPKKMAEEKGADRLLCDPQGFLKSAKAARLPVLPDIEMVEFETSEFLENARDQLYFTPNRIISKSKRGNGGSSPAGFTRIGVCWRRSQNI